MNTQAPELPISDFGWTVPAWICPKIHLSDLAAIDQGGCESGAYMPAVTYCDALATMGEHGDDVLEYIDDACPMAIREDESWAGFCCRVLSTAVEMWAARELEAWQEMRGDDPRGQLASFMGGAWEAAALEAGAGEHSRTEREAFLLAQLCAGQTPAAAAAALDARLGH